MLPVLPVLLLAVAAEVANDGSSCGDVPALPIGDVALVLVDSQSEGSRLPIRTHQLLQAYVRGTLRGSAAARPPSTRLAICRFGQPYGLEVLTLGGFTADVAEAARALDLALAEDAAAAAAAMARRIDVNVPSDQSIITLLDATTETLLPHPALARRTGVPQAVLVVGAVDSGGRSTNPADKDERTADPSLVLNLRKLATRVDIAAADMYNAALQLRNSTARAMAAEERATGLGADAAGGPWFPSQDTLRMAFVLSGTGAGRRVAEAALGEPYFSRVAASVDGGEIELGVAVKLSRLVREKAPSRSLQVRLLDEGVWTAVWDGDGGSDDQRAADSGSSGTGPDANDRDHGMWHPLRLNDTALLPMPMPRLPIARQSLDDTVRQCLQSIDDGMKPDQSHRQAVSTSLQVPKLFRAVEPQHEISEWTAQLSPSGYSADSTRKQAEQDAQTKGRDRSDASNAAEGIHDLRELQQFAADAERGDEPLLLSPSRLSGWNPSLNGSLSRWHTQQRVILRDGLCASAREGTQIRQVHVIDAHDEPREGELQEKLGSRRALFARVDARSGFSRIGLADVEPAPRFSENENDPGESHSSDSWGERGADGSQEGFRHSEDVGWSDVFGLGSLRGPWAPLTSMRTRTMSMRSALELAGWDADCSISESQSAGNEGGVEGRHHADVQADVETGDTRSAGVNAMGTGSNETSALATSATTLRHRWVSWSGAVPAQVRSQLFATLAPFFPADRPSEMVLNVRALYRCRKDRVKSGTVSKDVCRQRYRFRYGRAALGHFRTTWQISTP